MRYVQAHWWRAAGAGSVRLTLLLVLGLLPATAGAEIVQVTPESSAPVELNPEEQARLDLLQTSRRLSPLSTLSPDGTTVLIGTVDSITGEGVALYYLNILSGELQDGPALVLPSGEPLSL